MGGRRPGRARERVGRVQPDAEQARAVVRACREPSRARRGQHGASDPRALVVLGVASGTRSAPQSLDLAEGVAHRRGSRTLLGAAGGPRGRALQRRRRRAAGREQVGRRRRDAARRRRGGARIDPIAAEQELGRAGRAPEPQPHPRRHEDRWAGRPHRRAMAPRDRQQALRRPAPAPPRRARLGASGVPDQLVPDGSGVRRARHGRPRLSGERRHGLQDDDPARITGRAGNSA